MKQIGDIKPTMAEVTETTAPHELSDSVNYIKKYIKFQGRYNGGYWLKKVKLSRKTYYQIKELVDKAMGLDKKYSRGGWLTNQLK